MNYGKPLFRNVIVLFLLVCFSASAQSNDSVSVYIFLSETCPICQNQTLTLRQLYSEYSTKGISFIGLFPNVEYSTPESIQKFGKKYKIDFPLKRDEGQVMTKRFSAAITPEVFVCNNLTGEILYKGKVDNSFEGIGKKRQVITEHYLRDALDSIVQKKAITVKETKAVGCFIIRN